MAFVFKLMKSVSVKMSRKDFDLFNGSQPVGAGKYVEKTEMERLQLLREEKLSEVIVLYSKFSKGKLAHLLYWITTSSFVAKF